MARVEFTPNLQRHLACPAQTVSGKTAREVLDNYFALHPRARRYILDDQGAVQRHVVVFVGDRPITDRQQLTDTVTDEQIVFVFQALSGG